MVIEEIHSYFVYNDRGTILVEFTICEEEICNEYELEIPVEELEEVCDLFDEKEWLNYGDDDVETTTLIDNIDETQLMEGLSIYINQNKEVLDY